MPTMFLIANTNPYETCSTFHLEVVWGCTMWDVKGRLWG